MLEGGLFVGAGGLASGLGLPDMEVLTAPALFNWVFGSLAVMAGLGALGLALWSALGDRLVPDGGDADSAMPAVPLRTAVEESLDDLRAEGDPRREEPRRSAQQESRECFDRSAPPVAPTPVRSRPSGRWSF